MCQEEGWIGKTNKCTSVFMCCTCVSLQRQHAKKEKKKINMLYILSRVWDLLFCNINFSVASTQVLLFMFVALGIKANT